jgi:hypothetical protein
MIRSRLLPYLVWPLLALQGNADQLRVAVKGKWEAEKIYYGDIGSFDGATLVFNLDPSDIDMYLNKDKRTLTHTPTPFKPTENEIVINLNLPDPSRPVENPNYDGSIHQKTNDVDLRVAQAQKHAQELEAAKKAAEPKQPDLRNCFSRGTDRITKKDPHSGKPLEPSVFGTILSIGDGLLTMKPIPNGPPVKYRLVDLSVIRLGFCE